jgi:hypothetical protein
VLHGVICNVHTKIDFEIQNKECYDTSSISFSVNPYLANVENKVRS